MSDPQKNETTGRSKRRIALLALWLWIATAGATGLVLCVFAGYWWAEEELRWSAKCDYERALKTYRSHVHGDTAAFATFGGYLLFIASDGTPYCVVSTESPQGTRMQLLYFDELDRVKPEFLEDVGLRPVPVPNPDATRTASHADELPDVNPACPSLDY